MAQGYISRKTGRKSERDPREPGSGPWHVARLRPEGDFPRLLRRLDPMIEPLDRIDERITARRGKGWNVRDHRLHRPRWDGCDYVETPHDARFESAQFHFIQKWKQLFRVVGLDLERR